MWLYKATRPGSGEHWAEVLAAALAAILGLPHAHYDLARWRDKGGVDNAGVVTRRFTPDGFDLVHGNELRRSVIPTTRQRATAMFGLRSTRSTP
jgi:hypothetical protein